MPGNERKDLVGLLLDAGRRLLEGKRWRDSHGDDPDCLPVISELVPDRGPSPGMTQVEIRGSCLGRVTQVHFGEATISRLWFLSQTANRIVVLSPNVHDVTSEADPLLPLAVVVTVEDSSERRSNPKTFIYLENQPNRLPDRTLVVYSKTSSPLLVRFSNGDEEVSPGTQLIPGCQPGGIRIRYGPSDERVTIRVSLARPDGTPRRLLATLHENVPLPIDQEVGFTVTSHKRVVDPVNITIE